MLLHGCLLSLRNCVTGEWILWRHGDVEYRASTCLSSPSYIIYRNPEIAAGVPVMRKHAQTGVTVPALGADQLTSVRVQLTRRGACLCCSNLNAPVAAARTFWESFYLVEA